MRVSLLGPAPPLRGGIAIFLAMLAWKLEERGHSVFWASFAKQYPSFLFPGSHQNADAAPWLLRTISPVFVPWSPLSWWRCATALARSEPDVVLLKYWHPFFAPGLAITLTLLRRRSAARLVVILDNVAPHESFPFAGLLARWLLSTVDTILVQSDAVSADLASLSEDLPRRALRVAPPGYDFDPPGTTRLTRLEARRALGIDEDTRAVLYFGLIRPYKGVRHLIEAAQALKGRYGSGLQTWLVGEIHGDPGPYREELERRAVGDVVHLENRFIPDTEIPAWFIAADLVVLPYLSATQSGVTQIAIEYRLPMVATTVGGLPEVVREAETGFLVPPGDAGALAKAIGRFFDERRGPEFSAALALEQGRYTWDAFCQAIESLARVDRR